jgi:bacillithiol biosynthesis cysteine-adding enzyme BshC
LELIVGRPAGSPLVGAYHEADPAALPFYSGHFSALSAYEDKAAEVDGRFDRGTRERATQALSVPSGADSGRLRRFVDEGGYMVTTGQQPGLFGGPLYSVYKGLAAARLAQVLEDRLEKPVVPVFWVASEDHDWAEANHTHLVGLDNELHSPELPAPNAEIAPSLHRVPLGAEIERLRDAFLQNLPDTDFSAPYVELLRDAAVQGVTLPGSFRRILEEVLGPYGVYFTDAADPVVKSASAALLAEELERAGELEAILASTASRLEGAGYGLQVSLLEGGVNLFLEGPAGRERLYREDGGFRLRSSGERLSREDILARAGADPLALSPNVLLRPVAESVVFPTLSYVAGPGETAYYAQILEYFEAFGIRMPVVFPRFGVTLVEAKIRKVLDKFGLGAADLDRPFHEISSEIARDEVPEELRRSLGALRGSVGKGVGELQSLVRGVDPTLKGPVNHVRSQTFSALDDLEKKIVHAVKRESQIALSQLEKAQLHLYPTGKPQERIANPFYYLTRYGRAFLDGVFDRFEVNLAPGSRVHG